MKNDLPKLKIEKNKTLAPYTTFGIGGPADHFCHVNTKKEMVEAINWAKEKKLEYFILGKGSNILVSDKGFRGLVIKSNLLKISFKNIDKDIKVIAEYIKSIGNE